MTQVARYGFSTEPFIREGDHGQRTIKHAWDNVDIHLPSNKEVVIVTFEPGHHPHLPIDMYSFFNFTEDKPVERILYGLANRAVSVLCGIPVMPMNYGTSRSDDGT